MKKLYIILVFVLAAGATWSTSAQDIIRFGLQFGLSQSYLGVKGNEIAAYKTDKLKGFNAGAFLDFPLNYSNTMGITMNMGYALKGWEDKWMQSIEDYSKPIFDEFQNIIGYELTEVEQIAKRHFDYLAFSLGYYYKFHIIPNRLAISPTAGWYFDMLLNDNGELVDGGVNYRQGMRMLDTGPQLGAFIDVGRTFQIGVDYKIGVTDIMQKEYRLPELPVSSEKNRVFSIYIRILFS